jgi:hypothetical protein
MAKLNVKRDIFEQARDRSNLNEDERIMVDLLLEQAGKGPVSANCADLPLAFLRALLDDTRLMPGQRANVAMQVFGMTHGNHDRDGIYQTLVGSPVEFGSTFVALGGRAPNCEMFLNGRWYPVTLHIQFLEDRNKISRGVLLHGTLSFCECSYNIGHMIYPDLFLDEGGSPRERTVLEVLHYFGYRKLQITPSDFNLKLVKAERNAREHGKQVLVSGPVVADSGSWWARFQSRALGTPALPRKAIIEPELEVSEDQRSYHAQYGQDLQAWSRLPFIRVFSLDLKCYVYADVDDVAAYEFDADAMKRLHLPAEMLDVLSRVFHTPVEGLFGDLIHGKHGGVVVLAAGNPGVGKTLTAEVYAEETQRPLYVLELGELGTNVAEVEAKLQKVFSRVARWNAVLQFDECEIFLTQRGDDLERSAIVGIFLRLLDYYQGILFLTTNRPDVLDHAVLSRVMLKLRYPDLDHAARTAIWTTMLEAAGLKLVEGSVGELAQSNLNGRQIRNLTRLAKILHPHGEVNLAQMLSVLQYGSA